MSRYGGSCEETMLTVFKKLGEDDAGHAQYAALHYSGMVEEHMQADESLNGHPGTQWMTGFLFPMEHNGRPLPVSLCPGRDLLSPGTWHGTPKEAEEAGGVLFGVLDTARPARFSGGSLVDWCHFRAIRCGDEGGYRGKGGAACGS